MANNRQNRLSSNLNVCHGKACLRGTRIMIPVVLDNRAAGASEEEILRCHSSLTREDIDTAVHHAAGQ